MHHLRFTPVRPPLRHRCTTAPPSRPITIPPQPSSWLESSIPPTLAGRECSAGSKYLRFVHRPSRLHPPRPLLLLLLIFAVLYSRMKRSGRLCSLIASRVTLGETLTFGVSLSFNARSVTITILSNVLT